MDTYLWLAKKLFIEIGDDFGLEYDGESYRLKNIFHPLCHYLELSLINNNKMTGNRIKDISVNLNKSYTWILGFFHGFKEIQTSYKNIKYLEGYVAGKKIKEQINVQMSYMSNNEILK
jgi:hypothetical protein